MFLQELAKLGSHGVYMCGGVGVYVVSVDMNGNTTIETEKPAESYME